MAALKIIFEKEAGGVEILPWIAGPAPQQIFQTRRIARLPAGAQLGQQVALQAAYLGEIAGGIAQNRITRTSALVVRTLAHGVRHQTWGRFPTGQNDGRLETGPTFLQQA